MAIKFGFYNSVGGDRRYDARDMAQIFNGIINDGVFATVGGALAISPGGGMSVNVAKGKAWFHGTWTINDSIMSIPVDQAGLGLGRIDVIILEINEYADVRANSIKLLKGIPSSTPVPPSLTNDELLHQIPLAHISIPAGTTAISAGLITNRIGTSDCPFVTGILSVINVDMLLAQWDNEFNTWFASLENVLDENTAANLLNMINGHTTTINSHTTSIATLNSNLTALDSRFTNYGAIQKKNASFTLAASDIDTVIVMYNSTAVTITIPPYATLAARKGGTVTVIAKGTGTVTFAPSGAAVLNSEGTKRTIDGQYSWATLEHTAVTNAGVDDDNVWDLAGKIKA